MKYKIYIAILFIGALLTACDSSTDLGTPSGPFKLIVEGPRETTPEATETYNLADYTNPESYKWTLDGPGQITGATSGSTIKVKYTGVGTVKLTVTNGTDTGVVSVTVDEVEPGVTSTLDGTGALKDLAKDTIFLDFAAPLASTPKIAILTSADSSHFYKKKKAFNSGTLGDIKITSDGRYYVLYTAGAGNGTPEALITDIVSTDEFGAVTIDSAYIKLFKVDNIAPLADLTYSSLKVNSGTVVTVTATFSEPVTYKNVLDSAIRISISGAGVTTHIDTLKLVSADDPLVYTYSYKVTGTGNGTPTITILNTTDLAKNDLVVITNSGGFLTIDNNGPATVGLSSDAGTVASIAITSTETGTASYLIVNSGDDAPTDSDSFFSADAVDSGSLAVSADKQVTVTKPIPTGTYDVYYISIDEAGNYGDITTTTLIMN